MSRNKASCFVQYNVVGILFVIVLKLSLVKCVIWDDSNISHYRPKDTGFIQELNSIRCVDYQGHLSGKSRWPFSCLLPASHLATGRVVDGTSNKPERSITPPWMNLTLFRQGQEFARKHSGHLLLSHIYGLFCVNLFLDSKEVLLFAGGFDTPQKAAKRYTRIANGIFSWYRNMPPAKDYPRFESIANSIKNVRGIHRNITDAALRRIKGKRQDLINPTLYKSRSTNEELWKAFKMDVSSSTIPYENRFLPIEYELTEDERRPLNQFIQAMTQFGFIGFPVLFPERIGLQNPDENELFAFNHLWAVIGYLVGIRDEYNISLQPNLKTARKYFRDIFDTFIQPSFFQVDFFAKILIDPLLEGINQLESTMTPGVIVTRILRDIMRIPVPNLTKRLNTVESLSLAVTDAVVGNNMNLNRLLVTLVGDNILGQTKGQNIEESPTA
ncbi:unnamed protein product [Orchesella dallaii]|uniref:ER-bound oxygenase mpaB/mpaB'/Rubber oxygenase catalytic domain-containing protein n=1 Tax=Orchesella dallaii TaxID=48710 RepID=A0ABP1RWI1_9HEXA